MCNNAQIQAHQLKSRHLKMHQILILMPIIATLLSTLQVEKNMLTTTYFCATNIQKTF